MQTTVLMEKVAGFCGVTSQNNCHLLELLKFSAIVLIILLHNSPYIESLKNSLTYRHCYIACELFFIITGFFLARNVMLHSEH